MNSPPTEDYKINFQVRLPMSLRIKITERAHDENKSMNAVVVEALEESFDDEPA